MNETLRALILDTARAFVRQRYRTRQLVALLDPAMPADVGKRYLAWYVELLSPEVAGPIGVEVVLNTYGELAVNDVTTGTAFLKHLHPRTTGAGG